MIFPQPPRSLTFRSKAASILILLAMATVFEPDPACSEKMDAEIESRRILIIYSGNTLGELKPCGCAKEEDQGGIERRMSYLKEARTRVKNTLVVDTGDNFNEPTRQGKIKARYLMQAMSAMKYDAVALGDRDFVYGDSFIGELQGIPWVSSNIESTLSFSKVRIKRFDSGLKAAVIAAADPDLLYGSRHSENRITDPIKTVKSLIRELSETEAPDLVVVLTHMERDKALRFLDIKGIDVVINGHMEKDTDGVDVNPVQKDGGILVQSGPKGQKMGELLITLEVQGNSPNQIQKTLPGVSEPAFREVRSKSFEQKMAPLGSKVPLNPEMAKLYEIYNKEVEDLFFASLSQRRNKKKKTFATEKTCKTCHPGVHETWQNSRHGKAYDTLRKINKAFDPECLVCHVTGLNQTGGFISEIDTPELMHVQCEACHGEALSHSQAPAAGFGKEARQACKNCHVKNHSPRFNFDIYWEKIKH